MPYTRRATWSLASEAAIMFLRGRTVRTAAPIALVVGTLISAVNQSTVIVQGDASTGTWLRIAFNYAVPFVVSSFGYLSAHHVKAGENPGNAVDLGTYSPPASTRVDLPRPASEGCQEAITVP
jgi:hypothetical protein